MRLVFLLVVFVPAVAFGHHFPLYYFSRPEYRQSNWQSYQPHVSTRDLALPAALSALRQQQVLAMIRRAGLESRLYDEEFTILVPPNLNCLQPNQDVTGLLKEHILNGRITLSDMQSLRKAKNLNGNKIFFAQSAEGSWTASGVELDLFKSNYMAKNGVIHFLKQPLYPHLNPNDKQEASLLE